MNLFDEIYDSDANIYGVIISRKVYKEGTYYVLWKNETVGFIDAGEAAIKTTGRNFSEIPLKDIANAISESSLSLEKNEIDWGKPKGAEYW